MSPSPKTGLAIGFVSLIALWPSPAEGDQPLLPESPAAKLDVVALVGGKPAHGQISYIRSTYDGRVRLSGNRGAGLKLFVSRPEAFREDLASERRSSDGPRRRIDAADFHASKLADPIPDHVTLCDPYLAAGRRKNPYVCRQGGRPADCYDVEILQVVHSALPGSPGARSELWTTPVTITVRRPKTSKADIARIEPRGAPVLSPILRAPSRSGDILSEPVISGDGRLLVLNSGDTLVYSVMGAGDAPCDARNWKRLDHVSKMVRDSKMKRYGIATYPMRDSQNRRIKPGRPVRGAYPWIDREGKNLFFTQVRDAGLFYRNANGKLRSRFEVLNRPRKRQIELGGPTRLAVSYFGLWSQGKIIVPDGRFNNTDFHLGKARFEPQVVLYDDLEDGVPIGSGVVSKINTVENQWNYSRPFLARSPRDVAWWVSTSNEMTGEVVFDDALDLGSLIYSPMNAAVDNKKLAWRDGFDAKGPGGYQKTPRIQNAAASNLQWELPAYGKLFDARVEPIAAGGVTGKGLWLEGDRGRLDYAIPNQGGEGMDSAVWTTAVAIDPRDTSLRRRLLNHPDDSWVDLEANRIVLGNAQGIEASVDLPASLQLRARAWTHLAFVSTPSSVDIYIQGFKLASRGGSFLRVRPGRLRLGKPAEGSSPGFRGWVDDLRVVSGPRDPESICNYSGGTLRGLDENAEGFAAAAVYPRTTHDEISARLADSYRPGWERYRCESTRDSARSCLQNIHQPGFGDLACVRAGLLFPEGPIYSDLPRPDSRGNAFCRTCHVTGHPTPGLRISKPLRAGAGETVLSDDGRRQPSQVPSRIHGFLPRGFLGLLEDFEAPVEGLLLDPLVVPSAHQSAAD